MKKQNESNGKRLRASAYGVALLLLMVAGFYGVSDAGEEPDIAETVVGIEKGSANSLTFDAQTYGMETGLLDDWGGDYENTITYSIFIWSDSRNEYLDHI